MDAEAREAVGRVLDSTWPSASSEQVARLVKLLEAEDGNAICAAIDAYCRSDRARFFPAAGDLLRELSAAKARTRQGAWQPDGGGRCMKRVEVPPEIQPWMHDLTHLDVYAVDCHHCGDTGIAQYWYDWQRPRRVYLDTEYIGLPVGIQDRLRWGKAICDCARGADRPEAEWTTQRYRHSRQTVQVYPRLADLRRLVESREAEAQEAGICPQAA